MFKTVSALVPQDRDLPLRAWTLDVLTRFLDGTIYDGFHFEFHQERSASGEYVPIAQRSPSVRSGLLRTVVNDSVSFLFSAGRFPLLDCADDAQAEATLSAILKDCQLNALMLEAATRGSVGSVVIWVRVLGNRLFFEALPTTYLTPIFEPDVPDTLREVREQYKVKGAALRAQGYAIAEDDAQEDFWFCRTWDATSETWYLPDPVGGNGTRQIDAARTTRHNLGFVPMIWVRNLPGGEGVDGACTFAPAIETVLEIDYQLSQAGRGLKYASAPTLMIKDAAPLPLNRQHIVGDALIVPPEGDAKLLEIQGTAAQAVIDYTRELRKLALESIGGSRADSDKIAVASSGRAMEMMNQSLIWLADKLRVSYGEGALLKLLKMVARISNKIALVDSEGAPITPIPQATKVTLKWPKWYAPTPTDRLADANALTTLMGGRLISRDSAVNALAADYDIEDVAAELARIGGEPGG
ncbi:phage portal protein [Methylovirgula sp. 4M-Z18]|uniref:phage portal protein n=1 Tax=Methylovirgula sp. 4M-Z18 TaxID=2293567 RepID=UPI000E2F4DE3|nr:phage portal protein [Methylovirgula sp. 4M-Z18]RFB80003.1 phage portal protein [Methylovirgula sp. 4M-Z18]